MKHYLLTLLVGTIFKLNSFSQSTIITPGNTLPNITSSSTKNGVVYPRMTTIQKEAINPLTAGTVVYDITLNCLSIYNGVNWGCLNPPISSNGPVFQSFQLTMNPSGYAPLAGTISVTSNQSVKLSYKVTGQDGEDFIFSNDKFSIDNDTIINLYGLYPSHTNTIIVTITNQSGYITQKTVYVTTDPLPVDMPQANEIVVNSRSTNALSKFILLFPYKMTGSFGKVGNAGNLMVIDTYGKVRWYLTLPFETNNVLRQLKNGNWLLAYVNNFLEIDLLGNINRTINLSFNYHHDVIQLPNNNLMYLGDSQLNNTVEDKVYTIDYQSGNVIDSLNLYTILDPTRPQMPIGAPNDWFHANALTYDAIDNSIIISGRQQSAVVKIDLATKQLKWILSDPTHWNSTLSQNLLTPTGSGFEQQWGQHSPIIKPGNHNTIMLFDNGNDRNYTSPILPVNNYTRIVEYTIDENNRTVVQNYQYGKEYGQTLFAPYVGKVEYINNDRFFIGNGGIRKDSNGNATSTVFAENQIRLFEVDRNQNVYYDISVKSSLLSNPQLIGFLSYRSNVFNFK